MSLLRPSKFKNADLYGGWHFLVDNADTALFKIIKTLAA